MARHQLMLWMVLCSLLVTGTAHVDAHATGLCDDTQLGPSDEDNEFIPGFTAFGSAVAISGDSALVGLPEYVREGVRQSGRVAVFECDAQTHRWSRVASLDPKNQKDTESSFGLAIAMHERRAAVAAYNAV